MVAWAEEVGAPTETTAVVISTAAVPIVTVSPETWICLPKYNVLGTGGIIVYTKLKKNANKITIKL